MRDTKYWKPIEGKNRCVALNSAGKRCLKHAKWTGFYHGDGEIYHNICSDNSVTWVYVELCADHASEVP